MNINCLICGVGGQGTVLSSRLIAYAAMSKGLHAKTSETIGMSQRGGSVVTHIRIGDAVSSMIAPGTADIMIAFEPGEAVRNITYLKPGAVVIVNSKAVVSVTATLSGSGYNAGSMIDFLSSCDIDLTVIDGEQICSKMGSSKVLNTALLAAACKSGALGITKEELENAIDKIVKPQFCSLNKETVECIYENN